MKTKQFLSALVLGAAAVAAPIAASVTSAAPASAEVTCVIIKVDPGYAVCVDPMDAFDIIYEYTGEFPPAGQPRICHPVAYLPDGRPVGTGCPLPV